MKQAKKDAKKIREQQDLIRRQATKILHQHVVGAALLSTSVDLVHGLLPQLSRTDVQELLMKESKKRV